MKIYTTKYGYSKQKAMAYAVYMMTGSAFEKVKVNEVAVSSFKLHYAELGPEQKYEYEEEAENQTIGLGKHFLENISRLRCKMHIEKSGKDLLLTFSTEGFEEIICKIDEKGGLETRAVPA